ncbi:MAG: ArnT family glycosyltransferase [Planctomycetota bacterium]
MTDGRSEPQENGKRANAAADLGPLIIVLVAYIVLAALCLTAPGLAWDEALYIPYAECYRQYFAGLPSTLNQGDLSNALGRFTSHPPLAKYAMAVSIQLFGRPMGILYAARVASVMATAALLAAVYLFTLRIRGRFEAALAAILLALMPRFFANGLLAVLDVPTALSWFVAAALFYLSMENRRLAWLAGLAAGLAFATKMNAIMLPLVLWPWGLYFHRKKALPAITWSLILTPVLFFALWPFLWGSPLISLGKYFGEKFGFVVSMYKALGVDLVSHGDAAHRMLQRTAVPVTLFHTTYVNGPPCYYALVMTAVTTPPGILAAAAGGAARWLREREEAKLFSFLIWNIVFWLILFSSGLAKAYDGVRLFLNIFPFVAILAALGVRWAWDAVRRSALPQWAAVLLVTVFVASQSVGCFLFGAFGLSYHNMLIGGLKGADRIGLDVTFWGETLDPTFLEYVNHTGPQGARIATYPMGALYTNNARAFGLLRTDFRAVDHWEDWDYLLVANRRAYFVSGPIDLIDLTRHAAAARTVHGVPTAWVVERER